METETEELLPESYQSAGDTFKLVPTPGTQMEGSWGCLSLLTHSSRGGSGDLGGLLLKGLSENHGCGKVELKA